MGVIGSCRHNNMYLRSIGRSICTQLSPIQDRQGQQIPPGAAGNNFEKFKAGPFSNYKDRLVFMYQNLLKFNV